MTKKIKIEIDECSFDEVLSDINALITMREIEGFDATSEYGLLRYLVACAKKQCGLTYKLKHECLWKRTVGGWKRL